MEFTHEEMQQRDDMDMLQQEYEYTESERLAIASLILLQNGLIQQ